MLDEDHKKTIPTPKQEQEEMKLKDEEEDFEHL